jgi:hypothetical protein
MNPMTNQFPDATKMVPLPPPEMVNEWVRMLEFLPDKQVFSKVAQWGADQELEACVELLKADGYKGHAIALCNARRPKPPSLKEQALVLINSNKPYLDDTAINTIRRALEQLND